MIKKHEIYKKDKWNMMTVEVQGRYIVLREISDQWGEETHTFMSRPSSHAMGRIPVPQRGVRRQHGRMALHHGRL